MSIYYDSNYIKKEKVTHRAIMNALGTARNRNLVMNKRGRLKCSDYELAAMSPQGRLKWHRALCDEFGRHFQVESNPDGRDLEFFWFSFADVKCLQHLGSHYGPRVKPLDCIDRYRGGLGGVNYIAMLEPGLYASSSLKRPPAFASSNRFAKALSWHCHGAAWGESRREMRIRFNDIEASQMYVPVIPNLKGCWAQYIQSTLVGQKLGYMCKTPHLANRVYCRNPDEYFEENWEFEQKEAKCRPGEHIHYFNALANYTLDQLTFAGGEGSAILQKVKGPFIRRSNA
jgi:hypothetical protein